MIQTRHDSKRGCGWRKPGGLYLVAPGLGRPCGALPVPLSRCPACGNGVKATRGWTWVDAGVLLAASVALCKGPPALNPSAHGYAPSCEGCPLSWLTGRHGLLWIGGAYYGQPEDFTAEAHGQGVSRRIAAVPKGFELGHTWVLLAHRHAIPVDSGTGQGFNDRERWGPGIFHAFRPTAVEYVVKGSETEEELAALEKRGITPVQVVRKAEEPASAELPLA